MLGCGHLLPRGSLDSFPKIIFKFSGDVLMRLALCCLVALERSWPGSSYLFQKTGDLYCLGFENNGQVLETAAWLATAHRGSKVLGATFMMNQLVVFDTKRHGLRRRPPAVRSLRLGLAPAACPSFSERPSPPARPRATEQPLAVTRETAWAVALMLLTTLGLCLVGRNLLRAYGLSRRRLQSPGKLRPRPVPEP